MGLSLNSYKCNNIIVCWIIKTSAFIVQHKTFGKVRREACVGTLLIICHYYYILGHLLRKRITWRKICDVVYITLIINVLRYVCLLI